MAALAVALLAPLVLSGLRNASQAELNELMRAVDTNALQTHGYIVVDNVFDPEELLEIRRAILGPVLHGRQPLLGGISQCGWGVIPNFIAYPLMQPARALLYEPRIHAVLSRLFGSADSYEHAELTGIGINRPSKWHKDILSGEYKEHYEKLPLWPGGSGDEAYLVVKVCIYLQDHSEELGLVVQPGTHGSSEIDRRVKDGGLRLKHALGSIVVFDQRITHRGPGHGFQPPVPGEHRVMISLSFGRRNQYTAEFANGTHARQSDQEAQFKLDKGHGGKCPSSQYPSAVASPSGSTRLKRREQLRELQHRPGPGNSSAGFTVGLM